MKKTLLIGLLATSILTLSACNTTQRLVNNTVQFPNQDVAWKREGLIINQEQLKLLKPGITKKQVYDIVGAPHYNYGLVDQPYWDYLLTVETPMGDVPCQLVIEWAQPVTRLIAHIKMLHWKDPVTCGRFAS
ncbi:MAG: hypothetical protein RL344_83 [Pseudomonadota bacterium]|jgi:outer membrane protein assembly factor BamE (lipoprotein component of BamABCDE complex)